MKIKKINRMTDSELKAKIAEMEEGQTHTYENKNGQKITVKGKPHTNSKYYAHLQEEWQRRTQ